MPRTSLAAILVREVADQCREHGDRTFYAGFAVIVGGGTVVLLGASFLRIGGLI